MAIVLRPHGKLNAHGAAKLKRKLGQLLTTIAAGQKTWIVDLGDIHHIDRNGLASLIELRRQAEKASCNFLLRDVSESVRMTLDAAHLGQGFNICPKRPSSIKKCRLRDPRSPQRYRRPPTASPENDPSLDLTNLDGDGDISQIPQVSASEAMAAPVISTPPTPSRHSNTTVNERQWTTWRE
ncbi:MAG: STAS domain-containing protein [Cyanobacteriota bacterium]